ncbi:hypothetical protein Ddye_017188 [Dipteronia dyeriana]|uniref:Pectinesterase n=1 Tax=Dipteronia dyeriana TaxID=168575 RepID=A0AAD9U929_9ROSI|nr:hypothetical protein Ddye_017188 [Dipteronia dyeriana]
METVAGMATIPGMGWSGIDDDGSKATAARMEKVVGMATIGIDDDGSKATAAEMETVAGMTTIGIDDDGLKEKNTYDVPISIKQNQVTQALAARIYGDKSVFYDCGFTGLQDTLWDLQGSHYFKDCYIEGAIDFIFGSGQSIYEQCEIHLSMGSYFEQYPTGYITANARNSSTDPSAFVFKTCSITGTNGKAYLGRAYGGYSRVIFADSTLSGKILNIWSQVAVEQEQTLPNVSWEKKVTDPAYLSHFVDISFIYKEGWISKLPN